MLKEKLYRKLNLLAIIYADSKFINNIKYFKYKKIELYSSVDFSFLDAVELGYIRITFKTGVFRSGKRKGQTHNHGVSFNIISKNLIYLYKEYNSY